MYRQTVLTVVVEKMLFFLFLPFPSPTLYSAFVLPSLLVSTSHFLHLCISSLCLLSCLSSAYVCLLCSHTPASHPLLCLRTSYSASLAAHLARVLAIWFMIDSSLTSRCHTISINALCVALHIYMLWLFTVSMGCSCFCWFAVPLSMCVP